MSDRASGIEWDRRVGRQAWMYSLALHAAIVALAAALGSRMALAPQEEPFRWNVAMVEPVSSQDSATQTPSVPASEPEAEPPPPPVVQPVQQRVAPASVERRVETSQRPVMRAAETTPHESIVARTVEPVKPIEPTERVTDVRPSAVEATPTVATQEPAPASIDRSVAEPSPAPVQQQVETTPAQPAEEVVHRAENHQAATTVEEPRPTVTERAMSQSVEQTPSHVGQQSVDPAPVLQHRDTPSTAVQSDSVQSTQSAETTSTPERPAQEERTVVAKANPTTTPSPRRDYGWVRDALWRRIVEMKHYPSQARLNHLEGKVVLRAVIKSDGNLGDLSIKESSGHRILDEAAMEVIRRICPVPLKHDLGKSEIVVMIPIDYRLE